MSEQNPIDPPKMIGGRRYQKEKERRNAHLPKEGKRSEGDGSGTSQATHPEESQVVDLSELEYLNYQDQVHHDVTDGGYDQDHIPEQQYRPDNDDIAAAAALSVLPLEPPFPGEQKNISLLHSYANHVALPFRYNSDNVSVIFFTF